MKNIHLQWKHGENECQEYYEAHEGNDYLVVFSCKWSPYTWMAMINNTMIFNKTKNDRERKKQNFSHDSPLYLLPRIWLLSGSPEYLMKKTEYCYRHHKTEISE